MDKILIYSDQGASLRCVKALVDELKREIKVDQFEVLLINRQLLEREGWQEKTALLIFPGGRDVPYHQALKGKINQNISAYVHAGGNYLGICAGGYYGCASIEFEKGHPLEVIEKRELCFFPGVAQGPAYGCDLFCYESEQAASVASLSVSLSDGFKRKSAAYFNGGCAFVQANGYQSVTVLARYATIKENPAAIVHCQVGKGVAILSGVHPEYRASHLVADDPHNLSLIATLKSVETERRELFRLLLTQYQVGLCRR